jgi:hypothetical protein
MDYDIFEEWLIKKRAYSPKVAKDVLSRCRRVERIMNRPIAKLCRDEKILESTLKYLWTNAATYIKPGANKTTSVSIIGTAVKLAHHFLREK